MSVSDGKNGPVSEIPPSWALKLLATVEKDTFLTAKGITLTGYLKGHNSGTYTALNWSCLWDILCSHGALGHDPGTPVGFDRACPYWAYHTIYSGFHQDQSRSHTGVPVMPHSRPTNTGTTGPLWAGATPFQSRTDPCGQMGHHGHARTGPAPIPRYATYWI